MFLCVSGNKIVSPCSLIKENHYICHKGVRPNDFRKRAKERESLKVRKRGRKNEVILEGEMESVLFSKERARRDIYRE